MPVFQKVRNNFGALLLAKRLKSLKLTVVSDFRIAVSNKAYVQRQNLSSALPTYKCQE